MAVVIDRKRGCTLWGEPQQDGTTLYAVTKDLPDGQSVEPKACTSNNKFMAWQVRAEPKDPAIAASYVNPKPETKKKVKPKSQPKPKAEPKAKPATKAKKKTAKEPQRESGADSWGNHPEPERIVVKTFKCDPSKEPDPDWMKHLSRRIRKIKKAM